MKLKNLKIEGVGGIRELNISFNERMNLLCGPNGIGKTTILECISHIFSYGNTNILKRNVSIEKSIITATIDTGISDLTHKIEFETFNPDTSAQILGLHQLTPNLISLKIARTFQYSSLPAVNKDSSKEQHIVWDEAINGINFSDIKNWFVNRYLYSKHEGALSIEQLNNFELAKKCFSILNPNFSFSRVNASLNEIMINTPDGEIYYEYLSSGFRSIISIIFGIIKEIEFRFKEPNINVNAFHGIILIDEVELHLHPEWQEKVTNILLEVFPNVQFFASTHSPHVIQAAQSEQIIALGFDGMKNIVQRELPNSEFGFQGWTVEEVLTDIMGMSDLRTKIFNDLLYQFGKSIDAENFETASTVYAEIDELLHPENNLRKLLKFQLAGIK